MVTTENYEEYMMMAADGELDAAGQAALQEFMAAHPALKEEYAVWNALKLRTVNDLVYPDKEALMQRVPNGRVIGIRSFALAAAAALLAAIVLIPALWPRDVEGPAIVHEFSDPEPAVPVTDYYADSLSKIGVFTPKKKPERTAKPGQVSERSRIAKQIPVPSPVPVAVRQDSMVALQSARPGSFSENELQAPLPAINKEAPLLSVQPEMPRPDVPHQPLIAVAPENKQAFQLLKRAFEARVAQATSAAKILKETALVIKLGNGSVNINL